MKKHTLLLLVFLCMVSVTSPCFTFEGETFVQKIMKVSPGMGKNDVVLILGEPESIVNKFVDEQGRVVEVWRYLPDFVSQPIPFNRTVSGNVSNNVSNRVQKDLEFWSEVQKSATNNPANPLYKPNLRKLPPSSPAFSGVTFSTKVYFISFVDGTVQSINLSER